MRVTRAYISNLEAGRKTPSLRMAQRIASALGLTAAEFLPTLAVPLPDETRWKSMTQDELIAELMANIRELTAVVREQKDLELERIAAERERVRLVEAVQAQGEADLKAANLLAQQTLRDLLSRQGLAMPDADEVPHE